MSEKFGLRHILVIVALIATLAVNFISQSSATLGLLQVFPRTVAELGEQYRIFFLPSGYVFSIWGVIYVGLIAFVVYHSSGAGRKDKNMPLVGWLFIVSCLGNSIWLYLFLNTQFALSTVAMLVLLVSLIGIYLRQNIGRAAATPRVRWSAHIPFSIYLGWITVATVANVTYVLFDMQWDGFGISGEMWAAIMMSVAAIITVLMILLRRDIAYTLVVAWALMGIYARYQSVGLVAGFALGITALILAALALRIAGGARRAPLPA